MIPAEALFGFFMVSVVLGLAPGPDNIFVLTQSAMWGRLAGLTVTLGFCTGILVHTGAVAFGVAAVFQASDVAFTALKLFGACYLLYLAWQAFGAAAARLPQQAVDLTAWQLYRRGIIMNVSNPKVSIFFLAFLPQFVDPQLGSLTWQFIELGGVFIVATILVFGSVALLAGSLGEWLRRSDKAQRILYRTTALILAALALRLLFLEA